MSSLRVAPAFFLLVLLTSCSRPEPPPVLDVHTEAPRPVDSFFDALADASLRGRVRAYAEGRIATEERVLFAVDFEDGTTGALKPVTSDKAKPQLKRVSRVEKRSKGGRALHIGPGVAGPASFVTPPIPVMPGARYTITWWVKASGTPKGEAPGRRVATAEALFFKVPSYNRSIRRDLLSLKKRRAKQIKGTRFVGDPPDREGVWVKRQLDVTPPDLATHLVVSFDHSRTSADRGIGPKSEGDVWFDDLAITVRGKPIHTRYSNPDNLIAHPSPLQLKVELPREKRGAETRSAVYAPAPSALSFERLVASGARFRVAAGLVREGWISGHGGVRFAVDVVDEQGRRKRLARVELDTSDADAGWHWRPMDVDLSAYSGRSIRIELVTELLEGTTPDMPAAAAAVFGDPILYVPGEGGRLVVLTVIDTVNAKHVSAMGYERETTPELRRIASKGMLFENARSAAPWTLASFSSLFTGLDAVNHGAGERDWGAVIWRRPLDKRFVTMAEAFRAAGFQTVAFMNNPYLTSAFGLDQGFTTYIDYGEGTRSGSGRVGVDLATTWLKEHSGYDRFVVMHLMDSHGPYRPPDPWRFKFCQPGYTGRFEDGMTGRTYLDLAERDEPAQDEAVRQRVRDLYDGALAFADHQVGRLFDAVMRHARTSDVTFIVTSDHGEELWEHGGYEHGHQVYDEMIRVPLVVVAPGVARPGSRDKTPVRLTDVFPTFVDTFALPIEEEVDGKSLSALLAGRQAPWQQPREIYAENELYGSARLSIIKGDKKLIYNMQYSDRSKRALKPPGRYEFFDLSQDPAERRAMTTGAGAQPREFYRLIEHHTRPLFSGRYVVVLDGGGEVRDFRMRLTPSGAKGWFVYYEDLIEPLPDNGEGRLQVKNRRGVLEVDVHAARALLGFRMRRTTDVASSLEAAFWVDGVPWSGPVRVGAQKSVKTGAGRIEVPDRDLVMDWRDIMAPGAAGESHIQLARIPEDLAGATEALSSETEERLRALGYIE